MQRRLLILSGPTHEYIDPVRFIGNASSGKLGKALAETANQRGFTIDFVTGPVSAENLPELPADRVHRVTGAREMLETARPLFEQADAIIFAAAVADYTPAEKHTEKLAKSAGGLTLHLIPNPDIAQTLCAMKRDHQIAIGFALQTSEGERNARRKLENKNLDGIVLNTPATLGAESGTFSYLARTADHFEHWGTIDKPMCAIRIINLFEKA